MSFKISEQEFIDRFIQNYELRKGAQAIPQPAAPTDPTKITELAKKLVNNLRQTTGESDDVYVKNLQNLPALLNHLGDIKLLHQGKQIVYPYIDPKLNENGVPNFQSAMGKGADFAGLPDAEKKLYAPWPQQNSSFYVYKDGLTSYLQGKQRQAAQEPNELLGAMIGRLIDSANKDLQLNLNKNDKEQATPKDQPSAQQFSDDVTLDKISDPVLLDNPLMSNGNIVVTPKNLKSAEEFSNFVKPLKLKTQNGIIDYEHFQDQNFCDIVQFLYTRANSKYFRTKSKIDKYYLDLVISLSKQYNCNLGTAQQGQEVKPTSITNVSWKAGDPLPPEAKEKINQISYPLLPDRLDFERIYNWINSYQQLLSGLGLPIDVAVQNVKDSVKTIKNDYKVQSQNLNSAAINIHRYMYNLATKSMSADRAVNYSNGYLQNLEQLMSNIEQVLLSFKHYFFESMHPEWQEEINKQIGGYDSYAEKAVSHINQWLRALPAAKTQLDKELGSNVK